MTLDYHSLREQLRQAVETGRGLLDGPGLGPWDREELAGAVEALREADSALSTIDFYARRAREQQAGPTGSGG